MATMKRIYRERFAQIKDGACVSKYLCYDTAGCNLALTYLPSGATTQECKV